MKNLFLFCLLSLAVVGCSNSRSTLSKLQGVWAQDGFILEIKGDTAFANPYGIYIINVDEKSKILSWEPIDEEGVAHKNTLTSITDTKLILDAAGESGQHEEWTKVK